MIASPKATGVYCGLQEYMMVALDNGSFLLMASLYIYDVYL